MKMFETERLSLRQMTMDDEEALQKIFSDPVAMEHYPSTKNREETQKWIQWTLSNYERHGLGLWIVERKIDSAFVGQCGIVPQNVDGRPEFEIGYLFVREHWGHGYATEAAGGCRDFGFETVGLNRLISLISPANIPSIRVAERIGMTLEKEAVWKDKSICVYALQKPSETERS